jgi:hypothetical protein
MNPTPLSSFEQDRYLTYPHAIGFADAGRSLVLGQREPDATSLWRIDLKSGQEHFLARFPQPLEMGVVFDIAGENDRLAMIIGDALWMIDLRQHNPRPQRLLSLQDRAVAAAGTGGEPKEFARIPSITRDGRRILLGITRAGSYDAAVLEVESGRLQTLFSYPWWANHTHFCPHDESWIGFCHEGKTEVPDRVWGWHATLAPGGRMLIDQHVDDPAAHLHVGHERWCFHDTSVIAIAFGVSPGGPSGLYEAFVDGRPQRLISPGDRDWHGDMSRDGRWAVVDTTGPHDAPGRGWDNSRIDDQPMSDILLIDTRTGRRRCLARHIPIRNHPSHPHPVFSPDGGEIFYNELHPSTGRNRVMRVENPM